MDEGEQSETWPYLGAFEDVTLAQALGISEKAFDHRIDQVRYRLTELRKRAIARDRRPPAHRDVRLVARTWGWFELRVYPPVEPIGLEIVGVGVARPGERPTPDMANSHHRPAWADSGVTTAGLGAAGGGGVGYLLPAAVLGSSPWLGAGGAVLGAGIAGVGGFLVSKRGRRLQDSSRRAGLDHAAHEPVSQLGVYIGLIRSGIDRYEREMAQDSRERGLDPIPLSLSKSPAAIEDELHQSMWDLVTIASLDEADEVLTETAEIVDRIDAVIGAAWDLRRRIRVNDDDGQTGDVGEPVALRPTVARLRQLRQTLADDTESAGSATDELGRLNGYNND